MGEKTEQIKIVEIKESVVDKIEEKPNRDIKPPEYVTVPFTSKGPVEEINIITINLNQDNKDKEY